MIRECDSLSGAQRAILSRYQAVRCTDIHCHCLPGLDDGPRTMAEAVALCQALVDDGITTVIATPHQLGRFDGHVTAADIRQAARNLNEELAVHGVPLQVHPGADVRVDERLLRLLEAREVLSLADRGRHVLLELPDATFLDLRPLLRDLALHGYTSIISHPERNAFLIDRQDAVLPWLEQGALLQLTAGSLIGDFGPLPRRAAWHWLCTGAASLVATDAHDTMSRRPCMARALAEIAIVLGHAAARRVCIENPQRVLLGERVPAIPRMGRQRVLS